MMLFGEITVHVNRLVHVGERCTVIGWALGASGRKHGAGTAVLDEDGGGLRVSARARWIETKGSGLEFAAARFPAACAPRASRRICSRARPGRRQNAEEMGSSTDGIRAIAGQQGVGRRKATATATRS